MANLSKILRTRNVSEDITKWYTWNELTEMAEAYERAIVAAAELKANNRLPAWPETIELEKALDQPAVREIVKANHD